MVSHQIRAGRFETDNRLRAIQRRQLPRLRVLTVEEINNTVEPVNNTPAPAQSQYPVALIIPPVVTAPPSHTSTLTWTGTPTPAYYSRNLSIYLNSISTNEPHESIIRNEPPEIIVSTPEINEIILPDYIDDDDVND